MNRSMLYDFIWSEFCTGHYVSNLFISSIVDWFTWTSCSQIEETRKQKSCQMDSKHNRQWKYEQKKVKLLLHLQETQSQFRWQLLWKWWWMWELFWPCWSEESSSTNQSCGTYAFWTNAFWTIINSLLAVIWGWCFSY